MIEMRLAAAAAMLVAAAVGGLAGCATSVFNPATNEAFSSQGDGTLTVVQEISPTSFSVEQTVATPARAKVLTLDTKTNQIFTITAEFGPVPSAPAQVGTPPPGGGPSQATPAGMRGPRAPMIPHSFQILAIGK